MLREDGGAVLELARRNQADAGIDNAEFLPGRIEDIPLPDDSVDVVLSNCVIGLSPDKAAVFAEAYRILCPGGRLAITDIVTHRRDVSGAASRGRELGLLPGRGQP